MTIELRHLRYFLAVAEELHFGRAAERLHISQPPLSQAIRALERELGCPLFERSSRHVRLTGAGEAFVEPARQTLTMADVAVEAARDAGSGLSGRLRVGVTPMARRGLSPELLEEFARRHPHVDLSKREELSSALLEGLRSGELDAAVVYCPERLPGIRYERLRMQELIVVVGENHRLAMSGSVALADLSAEVFLVIRRSLNPAYQPAFEALCRRAGFAPRIGTDTVEFDEDLTAVRGGRGVLVTTRDYVVGGLPGIRVLDLDPPESLPVELATLEGETAPALGRFVELARELRDERGWTSVADEAAA